MTYHNSPEILLSLFPEFKLMSTYDESDLQNPYIFVSQFIPYLRGLWSSGKLNSSDQRISDLFNHLNELEATSPENDDFICTGVFESMLHGEDSDKLFEEAAEKYLSARLFDEFRFVKSGRAGTLQEFLEWERSHKNK